MTRKILFIITGDPRQDPRPAEAIRIAAGVGAWSKVEVSVYLHSSAALALAESADEFVDADNYTRYLPVLGEQNRRLYVQAGSRWLAGLTEPALSYETLGEAGLAELAAGCDYVIRF